MIGGGVEKPVEQAFGAAADSRRSRRDLDNWIIHGFLLQKDIFICWLTSSRRSERT